MSANRVWPDDVQILPKIEAPLAPLASADDAPVVFCDEAGYTGDNLLDRDQPFFSYSAVQLDEGRAQQVIQTACESNRVQAPEIKGSSLVKSAAGRKLALALIEDVQESTRFAICHKGFALSGKVFEYLVEPVIADKSTLHYGIGLHQFVAMGISMESGHPMVQEFLTEFQSLMRTGDYLGTRFVFERPSAGFPPITRGVLQIAHANPEPIQGEIDYLKTTSEGAARPKWVLDQTSSALKGILADQCDRLGWVQVVCDESKPLAAFLPYFQSFIGNGQRVYMRVDGDWRLYSPNLAGIRLASSVGSYGLQLADVVASSVAYGFSHRDDFAREVEARLSGKLGLGSVLPFHGFIDPRTLKGRASAILFRELCRRAKCKRPLNDGIDKYFSTVLKILGSSWIRDR